MSQVRHRLLFSSFGASRVFSEREKVTTSLGFIDVRDSSIYNRKDVDMDVNMYDFINPLLARTFSYAR